MTGAHPAAPSGAAAITGLGAVSAFGIGAPMAWSGLTAGRSAIGRIEGIPEGALGFAHGATLGGYQPRDHFDRKTTDLLDRFAQFALLAAREAVADSGILWNDALRARTAVITGSCVGGQNSEDAAYAQLYGERKPRVHPLAIPRIMANAGASSIATEFGTLGPAYTVSTACSSANHALGQALWLLRSGACDLAIAGGSEAPFAFGHLKAWEALRVISPDTCRPFARDRSGTILGEGAAMVVLEPLERARARGARVYALLAGFGMSSDAHHVTQPSVDGPARAMRAALADAALAPQDIDYVNAHGTATLANDPIEAQALGAVFGERTPHLWVSSTKSMHGHALGAAGALEAVATVLALYHGIVPPTANFTEPDPACPLDVVPNQARERRLRAALSNSFAFGGLNAVLAFRSAG